MELKYKLNLARYAQSGDFDITYAPLRNLIENGQITGFNVDNTIFDLDLKHPVTIDCQQSYDGTVNLILTDDKNPPRLINTRFSKIEDNKFKVINRNQSQQTNLYNVNKLDQQTRLIKDADKIPVIKLKAITSGGKLPGGTYTYYIRLADDDTNKTDFLAESGPVSVFHGNYSKIKSISAPLVDETTDKIVKLSISNIDLSYQKIYLYFSRDTSDTNGVRSTKTYQVTEPYSITGSTTEIILTGYETLTEVSVDSLNIQYNIINSAKSETQVQNMLFFGNIQQNVSPTEQLRQISYWIRVSVKQSSSIGWVNPEDYSTYNADKPDQCEYYNPLNLYYKLGYWPNELYRLGIVYIMKDGSLSQVYNLRGRSLLKLDDGESEETVSNISSNYSELDESELEETLEQNTVLNYPNFLDNTYGVFKNPNATVIDYAKHEVKPLYYHIEIRRELLNKLYGLGVKGYFFVRQKRLPLTICQGFTIGLDKNCHTPVLYETLSGGKSVYVAESFLSQYSNSIRQLTTDYGSHRVTRNSAGSGTGLLSLDAMVIPDLKSEFNGSSFPVYRVTSDLKLERDASASSDNKKRHFFTNGTNVTQQTPIYDGEYDLTYIDSNCLSKYYDGYTFATQLGNESDITQLGFLDDYKEAEDNSELARGLFTPYVCVPGTLKPSQMYNIMQRDYSEAYMEDYVSVRGKDQSPFYAISDRFEIDPTQTNGIKEHDCYRGDCFTNTITMRINRNFTDPETPVNETIVDPLTWHDNYKGYGSMRNDVDEVHELEKGEGDWSWINRADVNTVPLGQWVTYKCLSNYNLGLRAIDRSHVSETALLGNPRGFYPATSMSTSASLKMPDSEILNSGFSATVGQRMNLPAKTTIYQQELFDNRVMFSDVQTYGNFQNAFRIFKSLDYQDIERTYGAIVKLINWGNNILCVFEHGIGLLPVNEKALVTTDTGQSVHFYGTGVLSSNVNIISPDYGSIWQDSIIRTPIGVYGVDTIAKKVWRFSQANGMEVLSDLKIQQYLNNHIILKESEKTPIIGLLNVKTHYNNNKGDVLFTFYNEKQGESWSMCYNERLGKWVTRYSWIPLVSENVDNIFYSMDQTQGKVLTYIWNNQFGTSGLHNDNFKYTNSDFVTNLSLNSKLGYIKNLKVLNVTLPDGFECKEGSREYDADPTTYYSIITTDLSAKNYDQLSIELGSVVPDYLLFKLEYTVLLSAGGDTGTYTDWIALVKWDEDEDNKSLQSQFYVHGRAGTFNELDYSTPDSINRITPCKWYGKQEKFEFEFVVNQDVGAHKIFNDLVIISNKVKPNQLTFEVDGDVYVGFDKPGLYKGESEIKIKDGGSNWDSTLNSYTIYASQECKNMDESQHSRRSGNICYIEDSWYATIDPIKYFTGEKTLESILIPGKYEMDENGSYELDEDGNKIPSYTGLIDTTPYKETRFRDKYIKIRVSYTGEDLAIITALKTLYTLSYA